MMNFFYKSSAFWSYFFFPKSCLKVGGAAYTRFFTVYSLGGTQYFGISILKDNFFFFSGTTSVVLTAVP